MKYMIDTQETYIIKGHTLCRVVAIVDIPRHGIKRGQRGGFIESECNLSQEGDAFVDERALVYGEGRVCGNALVYGDAHIFDNAIVTDDARVGGRTDVCGETEISGHSYVHNTVCAMADWIGGVLYAYRDASMDPGPVDHLILKDQTVLDCEITGHRWLKRGTYLPLFKPEEQAPSAMDTPEAHLKAKHNAAKDDDDTFVNDRIAAII